MERETKRLLIGATLLVAAWMIVVAYAIAYGDTAHAQTSGGTAVLTCTAPAANADGSPFDASQLPLQYRFYEGTATGNYPNSSPLQATCSYTWTGLAPGTHYFAARAIDHQGATSALSNEASKVIPAPKPGAPTGLTVTGDPTAWTIVTSRDRVALVAVGTVAPGTACDTAQPVLGGYVVPRAAVTFAGNVQPQAVVSLGCSGG